MQENTEEQKLLKYTKLSSLAKDFVHIAKRFGKIIISGKDSFLHHLQIVFSYLSTLKSAFFHKANEPSLQL
jgi:hypothetical protein